jgi:hypothetical protein
VWVEGGRIGSPKDVGVELFSITFHPSFENDKETGVGSVV